MHAMPWLHVAGALGVLAVGATAAGASAADARLRADLEVVARRTILFGHQSVGTDILGGLRDLSGEEGIPLRIAEVTSAAGVAPGTCAHVFVADNGNPALKLESFERALGAGPAPVDVALIKFCFVDVTEATDPRALFDRYQAAVKALQARHPRTVFVHATVPLTVVPTGPKAFVKRLLGRERSEHQNARREAYNALVRGAYQGKEPLLDVARIESTRPDGTDETYPVDGRPVPALVPAYTHDGGHLNATGRRRVARELVRVVAALPPRDAAQVGAPRAAPAPGR